MSRDLDKLPKHIVSLSGGLDSAVALAHTLGMALVTAENVMAVTFYYGSKHNKHENACAHKLAAYYGIKIRQIDISQIMGGFKSALTNPNHCVPEGHYEAETMRQTVVPNRNMILTSVLVGLAQSDEYDGVTIGVHQGDHFIYPDCRPAFTQSLRYAILEATEGKVVLFTPLQSMNKADIVGVGDKMGVPFHLTRTCYTSDEVACGKCGSCQERLEAFFLNGKEDPIEYQSRELIRKIK